MHASRRWFALAAALAVAGAPVIATAEDPRTSGGRGLLEGLRAYALVGGGIGDFAKSEVKDRFDVGGAWQLGLGVGSRSYVGAELAYVGSARSEKGSGTDLISSGAEGILRVQYPYAAGAWLVEPFAFGGIGWSRTILRDAPPGVKDSDDVGVVPFGGGITFGYRRLLLDARFTYRETFDEDLALRAGEAPAKLSQWGVTAAVGYEF